MSTTTRILTKVAWGVRAADRLLASTPWRLTLFALLALCAAWPYLSSASELNWFRDAQMLMPYERTATWSVLRHHQAPLWDPYYCGGIYALGTPQSRFVAPSFLLSLVMGPLRAEAATVFLLFAIGLEGMFRYARARGASALGATLCAPIFALSGLFGLSITFGWVHFFGFQLWPWIVLGFRRALRGSTIGAVLTAGGFAWVIAFAGTYPMPMGALLCAFELVEYLAMNVRRPSHLLRALGMASLSVIITTGLCGVRLWPVIESVIAAPRRLGGAPGNTFTDVFDALFRQVDLSGGEWHNVKGVFFIGALVVAPIVVGLMHRKSIPMVVLIAIAAWTATGHHYGWSPYVALRNLPLYSMLRTPERYLLVVAFGGAVVGALGLTILALRVRRRSKWWVVPYVLCAVTMMVGVVPLIGLQHYATQARALVQEPPSLEQEFRQARGNRWVAAYFGPLSRGSLSCMDAYPVPMSPLLRGDLPQEEYLVEPTAGSVERVAWSPNRIDLAVKVERPTRLRINQNWHGGWTSSVGTVVSEEGLLAIDLPAGAFPVRVQFRPRSAIGGLIATLCAAAVCVWLVRRELRRQPIADKRDFARAFVYALVPLASVGASLALMREPWPKRPPYRSPDGRLVELDELPGETQAVGATFDIPVRLEATSELKSTSIGKSQLLDLIWRVDGEVPRGASVFVHVEPETGSGIRADHRVLSQSYTLWRAPRGKLLRDVVVLTVPEKSPRGRWNVWVGLWNDLPGQGQRYLARDAKGDRLAQDRVLVGTFEVE